MYDDFQKQAYKTDAYFTNHISLTLSHTKYQMTNGWFMTMSLSWVEAKIQRPELQRDPCHILVHHNTIRGWHMHRALSLYTVLVHSRCALSLVPGTMHCAPSLCTVHHCTAVWSGGDICIARFEKWLPDCAHPKMSHNAIMNCCTDEKTGAL